MTDAIRYEATGAISEDTGISIMSANKHITMSYADLEKFHHGDSWFGCTVGFRAMQVAAAALSRNGLWSRDQLYVVSGHPGPGVKDAIEMVTHCISSKRFQLLDDQNTKGCNKDMKFEWWVSDGSVTAHIKLDDDIVPDSFYARADRLTNNTEESSDREKFTQEKNMLSHKLWQQPLATSFAVEVLPMALNIGELPHA